MSALSQRAFVAMLTLLVLTMVTSAANAQSGYDDVGSMVNDIRQFSLEAFNGHNNANSDYFVEGESSRYFIEIVADEGGSRILFYLQEGSDQGELVGFDDLESFYDFLDRRLLGLLPGGENLQTITGSTIVDAPGGPLDEIFSQITLGTGVFRRPFASLIDSQVEEGGALDLMAATVKYSRFHYKGVEGNVYGIAMGAIRETKHWRYGILFPYDRIDYDGTSQDADSFSASPFIQYVIRREKYKILLGPYLYGNYTFLHDADNFGMWGVGVSGAVERHFDPIWVRLGVAGEYINSDIDHSVDSVVRGRLGGTIGFPIIPEKLEGRLFAIGTLADEGFLGGDKEYATAGGEISAQIGDAFAMTAGYLGSIGHESLSSHTGYLGALFALR